MEKHAFHVWRYGAPLLVLAAGAAALWPFRHQLTAEAIAAFSPRQTVLAASFLVGLYALKSLSVCFPMSALTAAGGLLFPFPLALAVNLCGTGVAQTIPFFLGRREQEGLEALAERIPRVAGVCRAQAENPWLSVFLLRLAGASPGDVVSLYLGASGTPYGTYLSAGLLGGLPRIACATVLGGALLLPPEKEVTVRRVWTKYIPRILAALLFWAAAYEGVELLRGWRAAGVLERTALRQAALNLVLFHHKNHLYYLHIILLVYAVLPLTRRLVAAADRRLLNYALGIWFVLGCLAPTLKFFPPLSLVGGIPAQYPINLTWCAVGYGVLGDVLTQEAPRHRPRTFVWLYLAGTALTFGLTLAASVKTGALYQVFLQGSAPGVCLQAAGLYGFCAARWQNRDRWPMAETVSKASFCIYLTHLFFLDFLAGRGLSAGTLPPVWGVPVLAAAAFGGGFLVWLVLRRVPVVKTYLI